MLRLNKEGGQVSMRKRKGQSILEYVIVLTVIVAAVFVGAALFAKHDSSGGLGKLMNKAGGTIENAGTLITNSLNP